MSNESDGAGKADNLDVIRKLLQQLEEAAAVDGARPEPRGGTARPSERNQENDEVALPQRAKPPVLTSEPVIVTEQEAGRELSSLTRPAPMKLEPSNIPQLRPVGDAPSLPPSGAELPVRRGFRSPAVAIASFAFGAMTAVAFVLFLQPLMRMAPKPTGQEGIDVATDAPSAAAGRALGHTARDAEPKPSVDKSAEPSSPANDLGKSGEPGATAAGGGAASGVVATAPTTAAADPTTPVQPGVPTETSREAKSSTQNEGGKSAAASEAIAKRAALSVARKIEGTAGQRLAFDLEVTPAPIESDRLLVVVRGIPGWASLTKGSSLGNNIWLIPAHLATDVEVELSSSAEGSADLRIELATLDGRLMASAPITLVAIKSIASPSSLPPSAQAGAKLSSEAVQRLVASGDLLLDTGDVAGARAAYRSAAVEGHAGAAFKLGETYDPAATDRLGLLRTMADESVARQWYEVARKLGSEQASDRLSVLNRR